MHKVKYNRDEYRKEYLQSSRWKTLRDSVILANCTCQVCNISDARDVHHLVYRNLDDVTLNDCIPVCRDCHTYIHSAIKDQWISQDVHDFERIKRFTLNLKKNNRYERWKKWYKGKHKLSQKQINKISVLQPFVMKRISGLLKRNIWYDDLPAAYFTGKQILQIRSIIRTALYRKKSGFDVPISKFLFFKHRKG